MALKYLSLVVLAIFASASPFDSPPIEPSHRGVVPLNDDPYRLTPGALEVSYYNIELRLQSDVFDTNRFSGVSSVTFTNLIATNEIRIHANGLDISEVLMAAQDSTRIEFTQTEYVSDPATDILTLTTTTELAVGTAYSIQFTYVGELRTTTMNGFYKSSYTASDGEVRYLGTTQFQPGHARKVFPCFDEPSYKAIFDIRFRHPATLRAVGNTRASRSTDSSDPTYVFTSFGTTPRMPTYLIAFVVSDFTCTESAQIEPGVQHFICSRENTADIRDLAVDFGPKLTWGLEEWTGVKFSVSQIGKIHQFAIPDFAAGAMENWGLITYREVYLLWDPLESTNRNKQNVITIVAHELAHFWFGNLVTTHWWSDTFLNEGFATYFEYHIPQQVDPDLETDKQFVIEQLQTVLVSDASPSSAALSSPASTPAQVSGRFSSISYNKGGSIFRMVHHFMGLPNFKAGINKYLTENQFSNTNPTILWEALQAFAPADLPAGQTIPTVMDSWTVNPGYPVLTVTVVGRNVGITQQRYLTTGEPAATEKWYVPISFTTSSDTDKFQDTAPNVWLEPSNNLALANVLTDEADWIILNNQQTGFYRVDYDNATLAKIITALNRPGFDGIHEINRAQLVDDYFNFARNGHKGFHQLLELCTFLRKDTSYYTWYAASNAFTYILQRTTNEPLRRALTTYILELAEVLYNSVTFNEIKDHNQIYTLKRVLLIPLVCRLGLEDCAANARDAYAAYKNTNIKPQKNLRTTIFCNGLRHSTDIQTDWNHLWEEYLRTDLATERSNLLSALGCTTDEAVTREYLRKSINATSGGRSQDALSVFSAVYVNNPEGVDTALDFFIENFDAINEYYGSLNSLSTLFNGLATRFTRTDQTDKFRQFIQDTNLGAAEPFATAALNAALANLQWTEKIEQGLTDYFQPRDEEEPTPPGEEETTPPGEEEPTPPGEEEPTPPGEEEGKPGSGVTLTIGLATMMSALFALCYQYLH